MFPTVLRKMFNLRMKVVAGYRSAAEVVLAIKRSEVDGRCGWSWSSLVSWNRDIYEGKQIDVVLQLAAQKLDELPDVPLVTEVTDDPDQQTALKLIVSRQTMARPYVAPPGVPRGSPARAARGLRRHHARPGFPGRHEAAGPRGAAGLGRRRRRADQGDLRDAARRW